MKTPDISDGIKHLQSEEMLKKTLAKEISDKYGITEGEARKILERTTKLSLYEFRKEIEESIGAGKLNDQTSEELYYVVEGYKKALLEKSRLGIDTLKELLSIEELPFETSGRKALKCLLPELIARAQNPKNLSDQITGGMVGIVESGLTVLAVLYLVGKGIVKAPYDLYLAITGKGVYENWKRM